MAEPKKSVQEFAQAIKAKYPQYKDIDDYTLAKKVVAKYPQYADAVEFDEKKKASGEPSEESASAPQSTLPKTLAETRPSVAPIQEVEEVDEFAKTVVDRKAEAKKANFEASGSINTRLRPTELPTGKPEEEEDYFTGGLGQFLNAMRSPWNPVGSAFADFIDDTGRAVAVGSQQGKIVSPSWTFIEKGSKTTDEDINKYIEIAKSGQKLKPSDEMQNFAKIYEEEGGGVFGWMKGVAYNPTVVPEILVSSVVGMFNPKSLASGGLVVGGATAAGAATTGPGGLVTGIASLPFAMGAAGATMEAGLTFSELLNEELTKRGMDFTKENVRTLLNDEKLVSDIRMRALGRGVTIGVVDGMTGKLAGSVGAKTATTTAGKATRVAAAGGIEMAGGSLGEVAGRVVAGQKMDTAEILFEGVGEAPGTVIDIASVVGSRPSYVVNGEKISEAKMRDIMDNASPADLAGMDIKIKNDVNKYGEKITDAIETDAIAKEVKATVPNISEENVSRIVGLEKELKKLSTATTQTAKDRVSEIKSEIKSLREPAAQPEAEVALTTKEQQDAIQKQTADEGVLRAEEPQMGLQEVGQGDQEPQVATQEGLTEEVQVETPAVDVTATETVEEAPVAEEAPAPKVEKTQEELDLETQEQQLRALEDDIQIEKDNFVERKAEIAEQIKEARVSKLSAPEKAELVASLRAELEDAKNESNAIIGQYREEAKALKKDVGKAKVKLQKKVQQKAPKAAVEPVATASPSSPVSLTAKELLFLSDDNPRSSKTIFSNILNKILYSDKFKSDRSRLAFVRKYVDPGFTYSVENKRVPMSERLGYILSDEAFDISKDDYQAFESAVANLGIDIDAVANDVTASLVENSGLGDYVDRVTAKKIAAQQQAADAPVAPAMEAPTVQPFARPGVYSPAYIKTKLAEAYKKLPTKKFVELFNKHVDSGLTEDIAKTSIGRDGYVNLFNSDDYVKFFKDAGVQLAKEEAPVVTAEEPTTSRKTEAEKLREAQRALLLKSGINPDVLNRRRMADGTPTFKKLSKIAETARKAVAKIMPDLKIVVYNDVAEYSRATGDAEHGQYNPSTKTIHINGTRATPSTIAHEVFHAVFLNKVKNDPTAQRIASTMIESIKRILGKDSEIYNFLEDFSSQYKDNFKDEEKLAELVAILSDFYAGNRTYGLSEKAIQSFKNAIKKFIQDFADAFGVDLQTKLDDAQVMAMLNTIARKTISGKEITNEDLAIIDKLVDTPVGEQVRKDVRKRKGLITLTEKDVIKYSKIGVVDQRMAQAMESIGLSGVKFTETGVKEAVSKKFNDVVQEYLTNETYEGEIPFMYKGGQALKETIINEAEEAYDRGEISESYKDSLISKAGESETQQQYINQYADTQKREIGRWIKYLEQSSYDDAFKYMILDAALTFNYDLNTGQYKKRTADTMRGITTFDSGILAKLYESDSKELLKDYVQFMYDNAFNVIDAHKYQKTDKGRWVKFEGRDNPDINEEASALSQLVQDTPWCTKELAYKQLKDGDFYVFVTGEEKPAPRIAVRMYGDKVAEARGIENGNRQDIEDGMLATAEKFLLEEVNGGEQYLRSIEFSKKFKDFKRENPIINRKSIDDVIEFSKSPNADISKIVNFIKRKVNNGQVTDEIKDEIYFNDSFNYTREEYPTNKTKYIFNEGWLPLMLPRNTGQFSLENVEVFFGDLIDTGGRLNTDLKLNSLTSVYGNFNTNSRFDLPKLKTVTGNLEYTGSESFDVNSLESVGGILRLLDGSLRERPVGDPTFQPVSVSFPSLKSVGELSIRDSSPNLNALESARDISINNKLLDKFGFKEMSIALPSLETVGEIDPYSTKYISDLSSLKKADKLYVRNDVKLNSLESVGKLNIEYVNLSSEARDEITKIDADISRAARGGVIDFKPFYEFANRNNLLLELPSLKEANSIFAQYSLLKSLGKLKSINKIHVFYAESISDVEYVSGNLYMNNFTGKSLGNLREVGGMLFIPNAANLKEPSKLNSVGELYLPTKVNDGIFSSIKSIGTFSSPLFGNNPYSDYFPALTEIGLPNFPTVDITTILNHQSDNPEEAQRLLESNRKLYLEAAKVQGIKHLEDIANKTFDSQVELIRTGIELQDNAVESLLVNDQLEAPGDMDIQPRQKKAKQTLQEAREGIDKKLRKFFPSTSDDVFTPQEMRVYYMDDDFQYLKKYKTTYEKVADMFAHIAEQEDVYLFPSPTLRGGFLFGDFANGSESMDMNVELGLNLNGDVYIEAIEALDTDGAGKGAGTRLMNRIIQAADDLGIKLALDAYPTRRFQYDKERDRKFTDRQLEKMADRLVTDFYSKFGFVSESTTSKNKELFRSMSREPQATRQRKADGKAPLKQRIEEIRKAAEAKRNERMAAREKGMSEAARKFKAEQEAKAKVKQEAKEQKAKIETAMDGYINAILESGNAKTIAAAFKNFQEVAGKLDKTEFVQQLRRTIAKLKEDKHISTVSAGNLNRILRTIERVSPATYALEVDRAMNAVKKEINTQLRKQLNTNRKKALKNIQSGRIGNSTIKPLFQRVLSIDASMIPDESFDDYIAIVTRLGAKQTVLPLADRRAMETTLNNILNNIDAEAGRLIELGEMYNDFISSNNLGEEAYSKVLDKMKSEGLITEKEKEMMKRYKSIILSEAKVASAGKRAESQEARAALEEELSNVDINVNALENRDDRAIATAIQDNLDAASEMTSQDLRKLLLVIDNINNGFLPHMGEVVRRKLVSINDGKKLASALNKVSLPLGEKIIVNVKGALMRLMGRKATETGTVRLAAERNPAAFIDEVFGNFKTTPIYDTLIRPMASAFSRFQRDFDVAVNKLNTAEKRLYEAKKSDNEFRSSMYKIQMYLIQREYETNVGNPEVRPAVEWIKATIDAIEEGKLYNEATAAELREQLTKFSEDGQVSTEKIEKSLTPAEKNLIKAIDEVNGSIRDKAVHVSDVIRGEGIEARDNYVHIQVFNDGNNNPLKEIDAFTERYTASTKAKSLITRTGKVNPINLDPYQTAVRGLKMTLLDYHMTPAIKQVNGTLAASKDMVNQRQNLTAVESLMQGFNEGVLANAVGSSMSPDITDTLVTNGYRAVLASVRRAIAETASNITFAISNPAQFTAGVKSYYKLDNDISAGDVLRNVGSVHTTRLFGGETLTSPQVEKSGFRNTGGVKTEMQPDVINKMARISKLGRIATNKIADVADFLMSTPDAMVSRPIWFGAFENSFKELTGKEPDLKKISDNDEAYMEANRDSIKKASKEADKQVTQAAASNNPYETIAKLRVNEKDTSSKKIYKAVNGFISRFAIFEYNTARRAIYAMIGNGSISRKEGAALLTGVAMRSIVYVMASSYIGGIMSALAQSALANLGLAGLDEEEEEEDLMEAILPNADTLPKLYRSIGGALANIFINRNFGNVVKNINGLLVETANEEYGQFLRNGKDYDPFENNILMNQLSSAMTPGNSNEKIASFVAAFAGPLSPVARTFISTFKLANGAINNKTADSRKEKLKELKIRVPLEFGGHLGLVPVYNDVRDITLDYLRDDLNKEKDFRQEVKRLINQYPNGGDKFEKEMDKTFAKYTRFKTRQAINKQKELLEDN
jgi:GNAT superfamily N-acetyltransferase